MTNYDPGQYQYMNVLQNNKKETKRKAIKEEKVISNMYQVCNKYKKSLDEITKEEITKKEYNHLIEFLKLRNYSFSLYPNLQ